MSLHLSLWFSILPLLIYKVFSPTESELPVSFCGIKFHYWIVYKELFDFFSILLQYSFSLVYQNPLHHSWVPNWFFQNCIMVKIKAYYIQLIIIQASCRWSSGLRAYFVKISSIGISQMLSFVSICYLDREMFQILKMKFTILF